MSTEYIVCGKLDNKIELKSCNSHKETTTRLFAKRFKSEHQAKSISISYGKKGIWFEGSHWEPDAFYLKASTIGVRRLLVLTREEYFQIVELASAHNISIDIFEINFPIFSGIKYNSNARINYDVLTKNLLTLRRLGIHSKSLSRELSNRYWCEIAKKQQFKNTNDRYFFFAYCNGYQEVFKLREERENRIIVALDFNSMYVDCMRGEFCNPRSLEYRDFQGAIGLPSDLKHGIYRVRLIGARESFMLDHHPFIFKRLGQSWCFQLKAGNNIETLLHKEELIYFSQFFDQVELIEGLCSGNSIEHPLVKKGLSLYKDRLYHRRRGDRIKENLCKISMQHMHSASNQRIFSTQVFDDLQQVRDFLSNSFMMNLEMIDFGELAELLSHQKYFNLSRIAQKYRLSYLDIDSSSNLFCLSSQVVANARLKMVQTLERFLSQPSVEVCYTNIDSIHLSIHRDQLDTFLERNQDIISDELGALKVETISDKGYWFDTGRYWLMKNGEVVLFKNKGFNNMVASTPFVSRRRIKKLVDTETFTHLHTYTITIENSFSYHKKLENRQPLESKFVRFNYEEIQEPHIANLTVAHEQLNSKKKKINLLSRIASESCS